jgi:HlyD family secretion protein
VTYRVIITTGNDDRALLPGMTADVEIVLGNRVAVLRVPNAALRFAPKHMADATNHAAGEQGAVAWILEDGEPVPRPVVTGLADDRMTEVRSGLAEGDRVIVRASLAREP